MKSLSALLTGSLCISIVVILAAGCSRDHSTPKVVPSAVRLQVVPTTTLLATIADDEKPDAPNAGSGHADLPTAENQPALFVIQFNEYGTGVAYIARADNRVRVVLNGKPGKLYEEIETHTLTVSPDGQHVAYGAKAGDKWVAVVDDRENGPFVERGRLSFSPDSRHVAYEARIGDKWYMFVDEKKNDGAVSHFDKAVFSSDSSKLMYVENTPQDGVYRLVVSDLAFRNPSVKTICDPWVRASDDNNKIAAVEMINGKRRVTEFSFDRPDAVKTGELYDEIRNLVLSKDGSALSYLAKKDGRFYLVLNAKEDRIPDGEYPWPPVVRPDNRGVGIAVAGKEGAYLHQAFLDGGDKEGRYKEIADVVYSTDGRLHAYVAIKNEKFLIVVNGKEGPMFDRVIAPRFSPDGKYLVYRARKDSRRFVVVADPLGKILRQSTGYERVFQPVFTADGKSVAYGVKDGNKLIWKVEKLDSK